MIGIGERITYACILAFLIIIGMATAIRLHELSACSKITTRVTQTNDPLAFHPRALP